MAGARVTATIDDKGLLAAIHRVRELTRHPEPLMRAIGVGLVDVTQDRFRTATGPDGVPWRPLNPAYAAGKRGPGILREAAMRGGLMGSITFATHGLSVTVGTNKVYGAIHQFGGVIRPKSGKAFMFRVGARVVHAKSVTIPARPYLGFGAADGAEMAEVVGVLLRRAFKGP